MKRGGIDSCVSLAESLAKHCAILTGETAKGLSRLGGQTIISADHRPATKVLELGYSLACWFSDALPELTNLG